MKEKYSYYFFVLTVIIMLLCGCEESSTRNEIQEPTEEDVYKPTEKELALFNTSWIQTQKIGNDRTYYGTDQEGNTVGILTFSNELFQGCDREYKLYTGYDNKVYGQWWISNGLLYLFWGALWDSEKDTWGSAQFSGFLGFVYGGSALEITKLYGDVLQYKNEFWSSDGKYYYYEYTYKKTDYVRDENGDNSLSYEKPDIGFYDYTAGYTSLKVQYRIYNNDEAKVSSAKIYYGESSNPSKSASTTVSSAMITANISSLKRGTTYYVKCVASGKGGTTTTSTTKCITLY